MPGLDKRKKERFSLQLPALLTPVREKTCAPIELLTGDVCDGGAYFHIDQPLGVGTKVEVELIVSIEELKKLDGKLAHIKVSGSVIRKDSRGMAVSFGKKYKISSLPC